jgi:hypothetical protein
MNLLIATCLILLCHTLIWFGTNLQLLENWDKSKTLTISICLAIPISLISYYGTHYGFKALGALWSVRFLAFSLSYLVFPILTWVYLEESPFTLKTLLCVILSFIMIAIQIFLPNS